MPHAARKHIPKGRSEKRQDCRRTADDRGYDWRWNQFAAQYKRENPLCVECSKQGNVTVSRVVDHIMPLHIREDLKYEPTNLQSLCQAHHTAKTHRDRKIYGSAR